MGCVGGVLSGVHVYQLASTPFTRSPTNQVPNLPDLHFTMSPYLHAPINQIKNLPDPQFNRSQIYYMTIYQIPQLSDLLFPLWTVLW